jgi:hypothetical protein
VCNNGVPDNDDETILAVRSESRIPGGVGEEANNTGHVDGEYGGEVGHHDRRNDKFKFVRCDA